MREIKFRGLTTKGEWVFGSLVNAEAHIKHKPKSHTKTWIVTSAFGNGGWFNIKGRKYVKPETVGQLTGFKDENRVDIYNGDLVALSEDMGHIPVPDLFQVKWSYDGRWIIFRDSVDFYDICDYNLKVIGNIHQNPELLES